MVNRPTRRLATPIGARNCQADSPADRATTSSYLRFSATSAVMAANMMIKGTTSWMMNGILSADSASAVEKL